MKSSKIFVLIFLAMVAFLAACMPPPPAEAPTPTDSPVETSASTDVPTAIPTQTLTSCVAFSGYPDNTKFGNPFSLNSYKFTGLGGEPFVNVSGSVVGLQFIDAGLEIDLSGPISTATLDVASFTSTPLTLSALDSSGAVVTSASVPGDNTVHAITLSGNNIVKVTIIGGGDEGVLVSICSEDASMVCVDFEPPLAVGSQYGSPVGQISGTLIFTENNISVSVYNFDYVGGGGTFNTGTVEAAISSPLFGTGQTMHSNNINLEFDFSGLGFQVSQVNFEFLDLGGYENLSVNGSPVFAGELSLATSLIGGTNLSVALTPVTGGSTGTLTLTGIVTTLRVGGQELWIDSICARE